METEKKEILEKQDQPVPGTGEQYLVALIKCADWVAKPYKKLALTEKNRTNIEVLKELYLCACDGVPVEKAIEAQKKIPPEGALRFVRRKHLEHETVEVQQQELAGIKKTTDVLEKEVKQMSAMLYHITEHVPNFDAMFPENGQADGISPDEILLQVQEAEDIVKAEEMKNPIEGPALKSDVPKSSTKKFLRLPGILWARKRKASDFIEKALERGYSKEQLEYLLDCIEEGTEIEKIERFASPKLPVDVMQRLRVLHEREEKQRKSKGD